MLNASKDGSASNIPSSAHDEINHPSHYVDGRQHEPIDVIEDWELNYCLGNCLKYISRAGRKEGEVDLVALRKAQWYLNREIEQRQRGTQTSTTTET